MKITARAIVLGSLLALSGCEYSQPLLSEHVIPIDGGILGLWEFVPDEGSSDEPERMMILRFSDTEYLVHYPMDDDAMYFRAYPIRIADVSCVQIELLGTARGPLEPSVSNRFHAVSYQLSEDRLTIRTLNPNVVDPKTKDRKFLVKAFIDHQSDPDLFRDPGTFRRIE